MPAGYPPTTSHIYAVQILTCDPTQRLIEAKLLADGRRVQITTMPVAARWPMVGETWTIEFRNNTPYLCEPYPVAGSIESIPAGDAFINSPTGVVHVIGSVDGTTDFNFSRHTYQPALGYTAARVPNVAVSRGPVQASVGTGAVQVGGVNLVIANPSGARCLIRAEFGHYAAIVGALGSYLQIDGDDWAARGQLDNYYFNAASDHRKCCYFEYITSILAVGGHGFGLIGKAQSGNFTSDTGDWFSMSATELS